jgi:predicted dehydrogenase
MNEPVIKIGIIGASFISQQCHLPCFSSLNECKLVAIAEMREDLLVSVANKYAIPNRFLSHEELICSRSVDAVIVVVARPYTAEITYDCLVGGLHVLTEKPMAMNVAHAKVLNEIAARNKLVYSVGYMKRFDAGVVEAKRIISEKFARGELPVTVNACCYTGNSYCAPFGDLKSRLTPSTRSPHWKSSPEWLDPSLESGYFAYLNTFSHTINLIRFLLGTDCSVAFTKLDRKGQGTVTLDANGIPVALNTAYTTLHGWNEAVEVIYPDSRLTISLPPALLRNVPATVRHEMGGSAKSVNQPLPDWSWAFRNQAAAFLNDIATGSTPMNSGTDSQCDITIVEKIWQQVQCETQQI